jgi:hypothetical protein
MLRCFWLCFAAIRLAPVVLGAARATFGGSGETGQGATFAARAAAPF